MASETSSRPSFSARQRWAIGLHVILALLVVLSVVVMANLLSHDHFIRIHWSTRDKVELHPRTISLLKSFTNQVKVTLYYDKHDPLYNTIADLLTEYRLVNPKITIQAVDYRLDPGAGEKIKEKYKLNSPQDKNLVIFDCEGRPPLPLPGDAVASYELEPVPGDKDGALQKTPTAFKGEMMFTAALLAVINPKPLHAYIVTGHGEARVDDKDELAGYSKFADVLREDHVSIQNLSLLGTNPIPSDCQLLIIPGPQTDMAPSELEKVDQYLTQGGRLLAMFSAATVNLDTGLEKLLSKWGVVVGHDIVVDEEHSSTPNHLDVIVSAFSMHPVVNPLLGQGLFLIQPRPIDRLVVKPQRADAPAVEVLGASGENSYLRDDPSHHRNSFHLMVAVEKKAVKGVVPERGNTRIIVIGDWQLFANQVLDLQNVANRDFASYAVNWLMERFELLRGIGPRPFEPHKFVMTNSQSQSAQWVLLAGMPGGVLLLGCLVWFRRRG